MTSRALLGPRSPQAQREGTVPPHPCWAGSPRKMGTGTSRLRAHVTWLTPPRARRRNSRFDEAPKPGSSAAPRASLPTERSVSWRRRVQDRTFPEGGGSDGGGTWALGAVCQTSCSRPSPPLELGANPPGPPLLAHRGRVGWSSTQWAGRRDSQQEGRGTHRKNSEGPRPGEGLGAEEPSFLQSGSHCGGRELGSDKAAAPSPGALSVIIRGAQSPRKGRRGQGQRLLHPLHHPQEAGCPPRPTLG